MREGIEMTELHTTPLHQLHLDLNAKMMAFAGYDMPINYPLGVMKEHLQTREKAGLFDVSHMGQIIFSGAPVEDIALFLESLIPVNIAGLKPGRQRYGFFTNEKGGILDDLMLANRGDDIFMIVNAACKVQDIAHLKEHKPDHITMDVIEDRALLALQGPESEAVMARLIPQTQDMKFMDSRVFSYNGFEIWISRSGYTGEDGFEISVPGNEAIDFAQTLLSHDEVEMIGLGARDSLRLEAGLCLYGHDLDASTTPIEGALQWGIQKIRRKEGAREGGFLGADIILAQLDAGVEKIRVGLKPEGRAPMREGVKLFADETSAEPIGNITSGGFGPTISAPVAMGYVGTEYSAMGTQLFGDVRGKRLPVTITELPFVPANFKR